MNVSSNDAMSKSMTVWVCVGMSMTVSVSMSLIVSSSGSVIVNLNVSLSSGMIRCNNGVFTGIFSG